MTPPATPATPTGGATPFVGRSAELDQLIRLVGLGAVDVPVSVTKSGSGPSSGACVVVSGDAGVGKTRILAELRERAAAAEWQVLVGHCLDFGDSALPYLPFSEALGRLSVENPAVATNLVENIPAVARLLPSRRMLSDDAMPSAPDTGDRVERADLFEAVHAALSRLAARGPLLMIVEDVHWADRSTREMLSFLFARRFAAPVALVASYRSDDLSRRHPLRSTVAEWGRLPGLARLPLEPLADDAVRDLVQALLPGATDEKSIVDRAEGNAFFAEELIAASARGSRMLPGDLADLLLVRIDDLADDARLVVRAASVAGRRVPHDLLARVVDLAPATLDQAIRDAVESNVLVPVGRDGYGFRHALLAEAVYDDLLPGERVRLHATYVAALRAHEIEGTAAELARHARAAHDLATALSASVQAGDEAMDVAGPDEAAMHYEAALELGGVGDSDRVGLTIKASEALTAAGHIFRSMSLLEDAVGQLPADAPVFDRAQLLAAYAAAALQNDSTVDVLALTTETLQLLPAEPVDELRTRVLGMHARATADRYRDEDAARWADEALTHARRLGLEDVVADAATTIARLEERAGDPAASEASLRAAAEQARERGAPAAQIRVLFTLGGLLWELGRLDESIGAYRDAVDVSRRAGRQWAPYSIDSRMMIGIVAHVSGDWDLVERTLDARSEDPPEMAEMLLAAVSLHVSAGRGDLRGLARFPQIRSWWDRDGMIAIISGSAAIDLLAVSGDEVGAQRLHDELVEQVRKLWDNPGFHAQVRLGAIALGQLATMAAHAPTDERPAMVERGRQLAGIEEVVETKGIRRGKERGPEGDAWSARLHAELLRLRWLAGVDSPPEDELVAAWRAAVDAFDRFGFVYERARSQARLAAVLRAAGETAEAAQLVESARTDARALGAEPLLAELRLVGGPGAGAGGSTREADRDDSLTAREAEVLALVASGRSNKEIGTQLYISAKTVSVHVSNILAKLGAAGRTEAVAVARRRGMLDDS